MKFLLLVFLSFFVSHSLGSEVVDYIEKLPEDLKFFDLPKYDDPVSFFPEVSPLSIIDVSPTSIVRFFLHPPAACQIVELCSVSNVDLSASTFTVNVTDFCTGTKMTFRPMENIVQVGSEKMFLPGVAVVMRPKKAASDIWVLKGKKDFNGVNFDSDAELEFNVLSSNKWMLIKDNPKCGARIGVSTTGLAPGKAWDPEGKLLPTYEPFYSKEMRAETEKDKTDHLLPDSHLPSYEINGKCCNKVYLTEGYAMTIPKSLKGPSYKLYQVKQIGNGKRLSVRIEQTKASKTICKWVRVCFGDKNGAPKCEGNKQSLELIFQHGIYIPTESDKARAFGVDPSTITTMRLRFSQENDKVKGMFFEYAFESGAPLIEDYMAMEEFKLDHIFLAADKECEIGLFSDMGVPIAGYSLSNVQALTVANCDCLQPK